MRVWDFGCASLGLIECEKKGKKDGKLERESVGKRVGQFCFAYDFLD